MIIYLSIIVVILIIIILILMIHNKQNPTSLKFVVETTNFGKLVFDKISYGKFREENNFSIFQRKVKKYYNIHDAKDNQNRDWMYFDYEFTTPDEITKKFRIIRVELNTTIADMIIESKNCDFNTGSIFGYSPLDFTYEPTFSQNYIIKTKYPKEIYSYFDEQKMSQFIQASLQGNIEIESNIFIYYENYSKSLNQQQFIQKAQNALNLILN